MVQIHYATWVKGAKWGQIWGRWKRSRQLSLLLPRAPLGSRPEMQLLKGFSPCSVLACCPGVDATSDGHMEHIYGKSGQLWQDCRHMSIFLLIVPSLSTLGGNSYRETHLQVILQGHGKIGVSPGTQTFKWREAAFCCGRWPNPL